MAIDKHPVAHVASHLDILLTGHGVVLILASLHVDCHELVANLWNHLGIVHRHVLVLLHHFFVKDQPLLNVLLVWLHPALSHLRLSQLLPPVLVQAVAVLVLLETSLR